MSTSALCKIFSDGDIDAETALVKAILALALPVKVAFCAAAAALAILA